MYLYLAVLIINCQLLQQSRLLNFKIKVKYDNSTLLRNTKTSDLLGQGDKYHLKYDSLKCQEDKKCKEYNCKIISQTKDKKIELERGQFKDRSFPQQSERNFWVCDDEVDATKTNLECKSNKYHRYKYEYEEVNEERNHQICYGMVSKELKAISVNEKWMDGFGCSQTRVKEVNTLKCASKYHTAYKMVSYDYVRHYLHQIKYQQQFRFQMQVEVKNHSEVGSIYQELDIKYKVNPDVFDGESKNGAKSQVLQIQYEDFKINDNDKEYVKMRDLMVMNTTKQISENFNSHFKAHMNIYQLQPYQ